MPESTRTYDLDRPAGRPRTGLVLLMGAVVGLLVGSLLSNLGTALVEYDESRTLGAACEHAEATLSGAPSGLLVGLAAAVVYVLVRRRGSVALAVLGGAAGALVALLLVTFLLWPLATNYLPVFVCAY